MFAHKKTITTDPKKVALVNNKLKEFSSLHEASKTLREYALAVLGIDLLSKTPVISRAGFNELCKNYFMQFDLEKIEDTSYTILTTVLRSTVVELRDGEQVENAFIQFAVLMNPSCTELTQKTSVDGQAHWLLDRAEKSFSFEYKNLTESQLNEFEKTYQSLYPACNVHREGNIIYFDTLKMYNQILPDMLKNEKFQAHLENLRLSRKYGALWNDTEEHVSRNIQTLFTPKKQVNHGPLFVLPEEKENLKIIEDLKESSRRQAYSYFVAKKKDVTLREDTQEKIDFALLKC